MLNGLARCGLSSGLLFAFAVGSAAGQNVAGSPSSKSGGSDNVKMVSHLPFNGYFTIAGVDIEQELTRPYVYVSGFAENAGFNIVSLADPAKPKVIYDWKFGNPEIHKGLAGENGRYFKLKGRYYYAKTVQFEESSPDDNLGLIVFDVTGLPDPATVKEVTRIKEKGARVVHVFPYRHSDGRTLLITTPTIGSFAQIYDAAKLVSLGPDQSLLAPVPTPETNLRMVRRGYHDTYAAYDPSTKQDKLYGAGAGGFHVFDITRPEEPKHLFSMTGGNGVLASGHTVQVTPDSRYAVATVERQYWPVMFFDLKPALEGKVTTVSQPIGAWTADWRDAPHIIEVRWPYVFVAAFEDGFQVINMVDPKEPKTEGWYHTCMCTHQTGWGGTSIMNGAGDITIRNADGLIVMTDYTSGLWTFRLDGFNGWNGKQWKMPNISTVQDWDNGPVRAIVQ